MSIITENGQVPTATGIIYRPAQNRDAVVTNLRFNNLDNTPWTIEVYKATDSSEVLLFKFSLDAGDVVDDNTEYRLSWGCYLKAKTNVANAYYSVNGVETFTNQPPTP